MSNNQFNNYHKASLILAILLISITFLNSPGTVDVGWFLKWANTLEQHGLTAGFRINAANYPPLQSVILLAVAKLSSLLKLNLFSVFKLSLLLFFALTSLVFWHYTRDTLITLLLSLSLLLNSVALGFTDIYYAPTLLAALFMLKKRKLLLFTCLYNIAFLTKWQPIIIAPMIALYVLNVTSFAGFKRIQLRAITLKVIFPTVVIFILILTIFGLLPVLSSFDGAVNTRYLSGNALNFNWIITHFLHVFRSDLFGSIIDGQSTIVKLSPTNKITSLPKLLFIIFYLYSMIVFFKKEKTFENLIIFSLLGYLAYFIFNTGVHENHLFIASILSILLFWENKNYLPAMTTIVLMSNINLFLFYGLDGSGLRFNRALGDTIDTALLLSVFNVIFFVIFWAHECLFRNWYPSIRLHKTAASGP